MERHTFNVINGHLSGDAPLDTAVSRAVLQGVSDGELPETLQVGMPHDVVAFGKHDALTFGFKEAVTIAVDHGYDPTIRIAGGRAVVFHAETIRFAWTSPSPEPLSGIRDRFELVAAHVISILDTFGVRGIAGELDGEYCPGKYSVSISGTGKVMGSGQRLARHASQIGGMVVVGRSAEINAVLVPIYKTLGLDMDPRVTGAVADVADVTVDEFTSRFVSAFAAGRDVVYVDVDQNTLSRAQENRDAHDPSKLA